LREVDHVVEVVYIGIERPPCLAAFTSVPFLAVLVGGQLIWQNPDKRRLSWQNADFAWRGVSPLWRSHSLDA
jgi:hypothetical protein